VKIDRPASSLVVFLGKACNEIAYILLSSQSGVTGGSMINDRKGDFAVSWSRYLDK